MSPKRRIRGSQDEAVLSIFDVAVPSLLKENIKGGKIRLARVLHWELCRKSGFRSCCDRWYEHILRSVSENKEVKHL